ncbi:MAG: hypothetical protein ACK5N0_11980 [Synechococcaceae cyanobacterium]
MQAARSSIVESLASSAPWLFVGALLLTVALLRLFRSGRKSARRSMRWFLRYWQSFFGLNYNPSTKSNLRKRHSRSRDS